MTIPKVSFSHLIKILMIGIVFICSFPLHALVKSEKNFENNRVAQLEEKTEALENEIYTLKNTLQKNSEVTETLNYLKQATAYNRGNSVVSSPYVGIFSEYEDQDLFASLPDIHEDYELLEQRSKLNARIKKNHIPPPHYPLVDLSGIVDVTAMLEKPYRGHHASDINLNDTKIDIVGEINSWATAFIGINYDSSPGSTSAQRSANSKLMIDKGFLLVGDLARSPFYASLGQIYIPFGDYRSYLVSDPLTTKIGEITTRAISLGYHDQHQNAHHLHGNIYAFQGDSRKCSFNPALYHKRNDKINRWGLNIGDIYTGSKIKVETLLGYITNLTDSNGMQSTSSLGFCGFGQSSATEVLVHRVPGASLAAKIAYQPYILMTEFVSATRNFHPQNMTYDNHGAQPRALHIEGVRHFYLRPTIPSTFILGYDKTYESIALGLPEYRYSVSLNINPAKKSVLNAAS